MNMQNKKQKGITLIALIITIVILLILAAVTIDIAIDGKLFDTAKDAVDKTNDRVAEEQETIDELMNEWDKLQENTEDNPNTNTGGENNNTSGEGNNNTGDGGEIIDNTPPTVTVTVQGTTTNSITVNVTARDNETGMVSEPQYTYYIKETSTNTYQQKANNTNSSYTYTGLTQGTKYDIKVEVNGDEAGNVGTGTTQGTTGTVTSGLEEGAITFSSVTWSSGKARVTIHTNTNYDIEYQLNGISGSWTDIQNGGTISNLNHGTTIYARLTDGNNAGDYTSMDIQDKTDPTGTITINEITAESIKVTVNASDGESGLATSETYTYYLNTEGTARTTSTSNTYTYINLSQNTNYTIRVKIKDVAGNIKEITQTAKTEKRIYTAAAVAQNPAAYYGKEVENYGVSYGASSKWKIFYATSSSIYLITADYIQYNYVPELSTGPACQTGSTSYAFDFSRTVNNYGNNYSSLNSSSAIRYLSPFSLVYSSSYHESVRLCDYLLDTSKWTTKLGNNYAEEVIGAPTLELFCNSYNDTHPDNPLQYTYNSTGYYCKASSDASWQRIVTLAKDEFTSLYSISSTSKTSLAILASPYTDIESQVWGIGSGGSLFGEAYYNADKGLRPVVRLKSGIQLEETDSGNFKII